MFFFQMRIHFYILLSIIAQLQALVQLPIIEDNNIAITETVIRNTVNDLFTALKVSGVRNKTRIKQSSTIHNFFVSITLKDYDNLKEITRLSTVSNIDNSKRHFIANINEVLNEGDKSNVENDKYNNFYVTVYIEKFIEKLKYLKKAYALHKGNAINSEILKHLKVLKDKNITKDNTDLSKTYEKVSDEDVHVNNEFWEPSGRRIYHGIRTKIKNFPFMASVHFFSRFQCAGSIIQSDLIITSSSCLQIAWNNRFFRENPAFLSVKVGCDYYERCGDNIPVLEIYFHPQYDPKTLRHNLAIMRLSRHINFLRSYGRVKKIDFDKNPSALPANTRITIVGWGAKDFGVYPGYPLLYPTLFVLGMVGYYKLEVRRQVALVTLLVTNIVRDVQNNKLSYAELDHIPLDDCQEHYSKDFVTHKNFCAGFYTKGAGACSHDAGGPGIVGRTLMGVVNFGSLTCGAPDVPTVFTKLGFYCDWIENIMQQVVITYKASSTVPPLQPLYTIFEKTATKKLKIYPLGFTTVDLDSTSKKNFLRIPQEQSFKNFLLDIFKNDERTDSLKNSEVKNQINDGRTLDTIEKQEQTTAITEKATERTYEVDINDTPLTTVATQVPYEIDSSNENMKSIDKSGPMSIEIATESQSETGISKTVIDDKVLEDDIVTFINNLGMDKLVEAQNSLFDASINTNIKQHNKNYSQGPIISMQQNETGPNNEEFKVKATANQQTFLNSIFFSGESSDSIDDEKGLSI